MAIEEVVQEVPTKKGKNIKDTPKEVIPLEDHPFHKISDAYLDYLRSKALVASKHSTDPLIKELSTADVTAADTVLAYRTANQISIK